MPKPSSWFGPCARRVFREGRAIITGTVMPKITTRGTTIHGIPRSRLESRRRPGGGKAGSEPGCRTPGPTTLPLSAWQHASCGLCHGTAIDVDRRDEVLDCNAQVETENPVLR